MIGIKSRMLPALVGVVLAIGGCSSPSSGSQGNKTLTVESSFEQITSLDPARGYGSTVHQYLTQTYTPLLLANQQNSSELNPGVAESYVASPDGLSVTFRLRHDVRFSDGTLLTSSDVVFTLNRMKNVKGNFSVKVARLTFTAPDPYGVVATSSVPDANIAPHLALPEMGIANSKVVQSNGGSAAADADKTDAAEQFLNEHSAGSGPYILGAYIAGSQITLRSNPNYSGPKPTYSKVIFINEKSSTQLLDVQKNANTAVLDLTPHDISTIDKTKIHTFNTPNLEVWVMAMNVDPSFSPVTANHNIRQAIRYGIDYGALMSIAGSGATRAQGLLATGVPGALPPDQAVTQNLAMAKMLVAQSGQTNPTFALDYSSDQTPGGVTVADVAQQIQASLKVIGITITLVPVPDIELLAKWRAHKSQALIKVIGGPDQSRIVVDGPGQKTGMWMNWKLGLDPASDAALAELMAAPTLALQTPIYIKMQAAWNEFAIYIPLFHTALTMTASTSVGGLNLDGERNFRAWEMT